MTHHVIGARNATPSVSSSRYEYSKEGGLGGFREAIGKLERPGNGFTPELSIDKNGNPRIDRGPQGPIEWVISFVKDLIFPNRQTEERQSTLRGLEQAIRVEFGKPEEPGEIGQSDHAGLGAIRVLEKAKGEVDRVARGDISIDTYNSLLRQIEAEIAKSETRVT